MKRSITTFFALLFSGSLVWAQGIKDTSIYVPLIHIGLGAQLPGADMAKRFGPNASVGLGLDFKLESQWIIGGSATYLFSNKIKEKGILDSIKAGGNEGFIIDQNGQFADVRLFERGGTWTLNFGRLFPIGKGNPNSGIVAKIGLGGMAHKIRIEDIGNRSPQLQKEYKKGYDRLTMGYVISEYVGYMYISENKMINFFAGLEFYQGFTRSARSYNFDTMERDNSKRLDLLHGIRVGWILPLYKKTAKDIYYY